MSMSNEGEIMSEVGPIKRPYKAKNQTHVNHKGLLYTKEERLRRDETSWTFVQGVLAPVQFVVFLVSLALVVNFLITVS